jgi:hypothetical protein
VLRAIRAIAAWLFIFDFETPAAQEGFSALQW